MSPSHVITPLTVPPCSTVTSNAPTVWVCTSGSPPVAPPSGEEMNATVVLSAGTH
ncbi:MAG: hypothetical protein U0168_04610 [Nannocystaceae bacterium]